MRLEIGEKRGFHVDARLVWNPSGVDVKAGERYSLEVTNVTEEWRDASIRSSLSRGWNPPAGWIGWLVRRKARAPQLPMYCLVGSIGEESASFFLIGNGVSLRAGSEGELKAFANDWPGHYENNHGRFEIVIRRLSLE